MIGCAATVTCPSTKPSFHRNLSRPDSMCAPICRMPFCAHMQLLCDTCGLHAFAPCSVSHAIGKWHVRHRPPNTEPDMQPHTSPHTTLHSLVHSQRHTHTRALLTVLTPYWPPQLGQCAWDYTPTFRGYSSFYGFYSGGQVSVLFASPPPQTSQSPSPSFLTLTLTLTLTHPILPTGLLHPWRG